MIVEVSVKHLESTPSRLSHASWSVRGQQVRGGSRFNRIQDQRHDDVRSPHLLLLVFNELLVTGDTLNPNVTLVNPVVRGSLEENRYRVVLPGSYPASRMGVPRCQSSPNGIT
jgi:hypothetical protein